MDNFQTRDEILKDLEEDMPNNTFNKLTPFEKQMLAVQIERNLILEFGFGLLRNKKEYPTYLESIKESIKSIDEGINNVKNAIQDNQ